MKCSFVVFGAVVAGPFLLLVLFAVVGFPVGGRVVIEGALVCSFSVIVLCVLSLVVFCNGAERVLKLCLEVLLVEIVVVL